MKGACLGRNAPEISPCRLKAEHPGPDRRSEPGLVERAFGKRRAGGYGDLLELQLETLRVHRYIQEVGDGGMQERSCHAPPAYHVWGDDAIRPGAAQLLLLL